MRALFMGLLLVVGAGLATGCDDNSGGAGKHTTDVNVPGVNVHVETPAGHDAPKSKIESETKIERHGDKVETKEKKTVVHPDGSETKTETKTERKD